jgi:hypothetical protein
MAANRKVRVMRVKDGSLLDDEAQKIVERMAAENDYQIFMEVVDTTGKVGVFMVDGEIAAIDGEKPPAQPHVPLKPRRKPARKEVGIV